MIGLFTAAKRREAKKLLVRIIKRHTTTVTQECRKDQRTHLHTSAYVVPLVNNSPDTLNAALAFTTDLTPTSIGFLTDKSAVKDDLLVGLISEPESPILLAKLKAYTELGFGLCRIGVEIIQAVPRTDYPELEDLFADQLLK